MSDIIDQRAVEMQFDNRQFEAGVKETMNSLDGLKKGLQFDGASHGLDNISKSVKGFDMSGMVEAVSSVGEKFNAMQVVAITALVNITNSAINAGKKIISALTIDPVKTGFNEYEQKMGSVQTIMAGTGESLQVVSKYLEELNVYADRTIYSFADMTANIGKFTNSGVKLEDAVSAIQGVSNVAAISGANANEASRAMYNFAQALSAGYVKLIDWKSIENANMATVQFKQELLDTALSIGTVTEKNGMYITTTKSATGAISDAFNSTMGFNDSLQNQWMTTDVLVKTLARYSDETTDIGKKAFAAAQDVKTFSQLYDTLKEAAQSGWAMSWEIMVGDFEEAKKFLTEINDVVSGMIGNSADARNALLFDGLSTGWKQFLKEGITDADAYKNTIIDVAKENGIAIDQMIDDSGSFENTLKDGWLTADILSTSLTKLTDKTRNLSDEQLDAMGYTRSQINELEDLEKAIQNGSVSVDEFADKMQKPSGRDNLIDSLRMSFENLKSVYMPIKEAFVEIFPPTTGKQLYSVTELIKNFTSKLILSDTAMDNLNRTAKGVFSILGLLKDGFIATTKVIFPFANGVNDVLEGILEFTGNIGDGLVRFREFIDEIGYFEATSKVAKDILGLFVKGVRDLIGVITSKFDIPLLTGFHKGLSNIYESLSGITNKTKYMKDEVVDSIEEMGSSLADSKFLKLLKSLWDGLVSVVDMITVAGTKLIDGVSKSFDESGLSGVVEIVNMLIGGALGVAAFKGLWAISDTVEIFGNLSGILEGYQRNLNAEILIKIGTAIAILSASLFIISTIDSDKLLGATVAISALFAGLLTSMKLFNGSDLKMGGIAKSLAIMTTMSTSILLLAVALRTIGGLDFGQILSSLVGLGGITAMLLEVTKSMSKNGPMVIKGATQMIALAIALNIMANAMKQIAILDWDGLLKGLTGIIGLMSTLSIFINKTSFGPGAVSTATGILILSGAINVLASACYKFGNMEWGDITKGLTSIGVLLGSLAIFTNVTKNASSVISTGVGLIALATAMNIFASAIRSLGSVPVEELTRGLAGMAGALLMVVSAVLVMPKNLIPMGLGLIGLSTGLLILSTALKSFGNISWENLGVGLAGLGGSLAILAIGLTLMKSTLAGSAALLIASVAVNALIVPLALLGAMPLDNIIKGLIGMAGALAIIGVSLIAFVGAVSAIGMVGVLPLLGVASALTLLGVACVGIGGGLLMAASGITLLGASLAANGLIIVSAIALILSNFITMVPTMAKSLGLGLIEMAKVFIDGSPIIVEAVLTLIRTMINTTLTLIPEFVGSFMDMINVLLSSVSSRLPEIIASGVEVITIFLKGIRDNMDGIIGIGVDIILKFIHSVAMQIPKITKSAYDLVIEFIDALGETFKMEGPRLVESVIGLGKNIVQGLIDGMFSGVKAVGNAVKDIGKSVVNGFKSVLKINSPSKITTEFGGFLVQGLSDGMTNNTKIAVDAACKLGKSVVKGMQKILKINSPSRVTRDEVGRYIVEGVAEGITNDMSAEEAASKKAQNIVSAFKTELDKLDLQSKTDDLEFELWNSLYGSSASDSDYANAQLQSTLKKIDIQSEKVQLSQAEYQRTLDAFGATSVSTKEAYNKLLQEQIALANLSTQLQNQQQSFADTNLAAFDKYADYINRHQETLLELGFTMDEIIAGASQVSGYIVGGDTSNNMVNQVESSVYNAMNSVYQTYDESIGNTFGALVGNFSEYGAEYSQALGQGIQNGVTNATSATANMVSQCSATIKSQQTGWVEAASYLVDGFVKGINDNVSRAAKASADMAMAAYKAATTALDIHSPSRKFKELGKYVDIGFAEGISSYAKFATKATESMTNDSIFGVAKALTNLSSMVESEMDTQPTIRPVLDLSDVSSKARTINGLFTKSQAIAVSKSIDDTVTLSGDSNPKTSGQHIEFTQINNSPKALSRVDIYRQTNNQLNSLKSKGLVTV